MKIAISGKGGVGKTTLAAGLALLLAKQGQGVIALDADPDANLASALGISGADRKKIIPISERRALIEERTGAKVKQYGQMFKLNPEVSDIAGKYAYMHEGVGLIVLGAVEEGGSGCACPESVLIRALVTDLVLHKNQALIMDMEAGIEHLGRGTARGVDKMIIVVEPGQRSIDCAHRIITMSGQIGLEQVCVVANKVASDADRDFIRRALGDISVMGEIPYNEEIRNSDRTDTSVLENLNQEVIKTIKNILAEIKVTREV
jgi:CO dehydrogenase maturation factor